jgi:hypothetical protein
MNRKRGGRGSGRKHGLGASASVKTQSFEVGWDVGNIYIMVMPSNLWRHMPIIFTSICFIKFWVRYFSILLPYWLRMRNLASKIFRYTRVFPPQERKYPAHEV